MIPFLFPFSRDYFFPLVALDKIYIYTHTHIYTYCKTSYCCFNYIIAGVSECIVCEDAVEFVDVILTDIFHYFFIANMDPAELKKLRSKQRKAAKKAEQNKVEEKKKEDKKSKSGGNPVSVIFLI